MTTTIKERPILFSAPMVRAILDGRKTMTRRIVKQQPEAFVSAMTVNESGICVSSHEAQNQIWKCPYGSPGDRLWVRETWCRKLDDGRFVYNAEGNLDSACCHYRADGYHVLKDDGDGGTEYTKSGLEASPWSPSIYMPRWASRITLQVEAVRVERLQEITEADAIAEGVASVGYPGRTHRELFCDLWDKINGEGSWGLNCWVWVVSFSVVNP